MASGKPNWDRIKAEYLRGGTSYRQLADKHGVPLRTLAARAKRDSWADELQQVSNEAATEIRRSAVASRVMSAQEVLEELSNIGRGGMGRIASWGGGGLVLRESDQLSPDDLSLVSEVAETRTETGGSLKVKLYDRLAALDKLAKHHGLYVQPEAGDDGADGPPQRFVVVDPGE